MGEGPRQGWSFIGLAERSVARQAGWAVIGDHETNSEGFSWPVCLSRSVENLPVAGPAPRRPGPLLPFFECLDPYGPTP